MSSPLARHAAAKRKEAADALAELVEALTPAGIVLPSAGVDGYSPFTGVVLVELGAVRPEVVRALAAVVRVGVRRAHA